MFKVFCLKKFIKKFVLVGVFVDCQIEAKFKYPLNNNRFWIVSSYEETLVVGVGKLKKIYNWKRKNDSANQVSTACYQFALLN